MWLLIFVSGGVVLLLAHHTIPRIVLRILTKSRIRTRPLAWYEVYDEIGAELKARRIAREVRREAARRVP